MTLAPRTAYTVPSVIKIVEQRTSWDCSVAALAMVSGKSYEEVLVTMGRRSRLEHRGVWPKQIHACAKDLGVTFRRVKASAIKYDETEFGILSVTRPAADGTAEGHVAVLYEGLVFDTSGSVWDPALFLSAFKFRVVELWRVVKGGA